MKLGFFPGCLLLTGVFMLSSCATDKLVPPTDETTFGTRLDAAMSDWLEPYPNLGVAVALIHNGEHAWSRGYGSATATTPVTSDTLFQVASISKPVAAWGVMALSEDGRLDLDAPVAESLTSWQFPESRFEVEGITARRLLSHSAGLSVGGYYGLDNADPAITISDVLNGDTPGDGAVNVVARPGEQERYSGGGFSVLELLVEEATELTFVDYMAQAVLQPLGMDTASFTIDRTHPDLATGHDAEGAQLPFYHHPEHAAASLVASVDDMARFVVASLPSNNNPVLSSESVRMMQTPSPNSSFGLGYRLRNLQDDTGMVYHSGSNRGWRSYIAIFPNEALGIVILTNGDSGDEIIDRVMGELVR